ncbi:MAG: GNAT family N-acetyltransferase [Gammaproteobacteria bacterium]
MCTLRDYRPGDESAVLALVEAALTPYALPMKLQSTDRDVQDIKAHYDDRGGLFRILEDKGRVVGSYGLFPLENGDCELRKMYLLPEYKGRGLGKRLLEEALERAPALGFKRVELESNSCLTEAMTLYRRYGFTPYTPDHYSDRCDCAMELLLRSPEPD